MHLTEQTDQPRPIVFRKCWVSCCNEMNVIIQKYEKGGGRGGKVSMRRLEFHFDASLFAISFFLHLFLLLFVRSSSFSSPFHGTNLIWVEHRITLPACVCVHSTYIYCTVISAPVQRTFKRPTPLSYGNKNYEATIKWFHK